MDGRTDGHPIWRILDHQGRTLAWLARRTEYSQSRIWAIKGGEFATKQFRERCAKALDLPEEVLFIADASPVGDSSAA